MATKLHKDDEEVQVNALIYSMGPEAEHIFKFDDGEAKKYAPVLKKFLGTVTDVSKEEDNTPWEIALKVCGSTINFKIDCGANVTVISEREYNNLSRQPELRVATVPLCGVGTRIKCVGMFTAKIEYGDDLCCA